MPGYNNWINAANPALRGQGAANMPLSSQAVTMPSRPGAAYPSAPGGLGPVGGPGSVAPPTPGSPMTQMPTQAPMGAFAMPGVVGGQQAMNPTGAFNPAQPSLAGAMGGGVSGFGAPGNGFGRGGLFGGGGRR